MTQPKKGKQQTAEAANAQAKNQNAQGADEKAAQQDGAVKDEMSQSEYIGFLEEQLGKNIAAVEEQKASVIRNASLAAESRELGISLVLDGVLPVLDDCERAKAMITDKSALSGFALIEERLKKLLEEFGVTEIEAQDKEFDANVMCAVLSEPNAQKAGKVLDVMAKGYMRNGKVLRYASVKIAT
jgi:molecular chaperone GrpE (heat shock protein)